MKTIICPECETENDPDDEGVFPRYCAWCLVKLSKLPR